MSYTGDGGRLLKVIVGWFVRLLLRLSGLVAFVLFAIAITVAVVVAGLLYFTTPICTDEPRFREASPDGRLEVVAMARRCPGHFTLDFDHGAIWMNRVAGESIVDRAEVVTFRLDDLDRLRPPIVWESASRLVVNFAVGASVEAGTRSVMGVEVVIRPDTARDRPTSADAAEGR